MTALPPPRMAERFRGYLPVVVDVETGGFDCTRHALLEIAAIPIELDAAGDYVPGATISMHVEPFPGAEIDPKSLEITGIRLDTALRTSVCMLLTGSSGRGSELSALDSGADAFLRKEEEMPRGLLPNIKSAGTVNPMSGPATYQGQGCLKNSNMVRW